MRIITQGLLFLSLALLITGMTGWAVLAIYFGDSQTSIVQTVIAAGFGLLGAATLIGVFIRRLRGRMLGAFFGCFILVLVWWFSIEPSNDREWATETARLPYATINGNQIRVHNIRNFTYRTETDFTPAYYDKTFDLRKLENVDLYAVYWMGPAIAHTMVSFDFGGEDYLAVSIEARKEVGEGYSTIKGFFRQFELIHIVGDERDLVGLRTTYRKDPPEQVYRYSVGGDPEKAKKFFLAYIHAINEQYEEPEFYNTLLTNCTNVIWTHAKINPDRVPFSWKILASGYLPEYLYEMDVLDNTLPFSEVQRQAHVNPKAEVAGIGEDFSRRIRDPMPGTDSGATQ